MTTSDRSFDEAPMQDWEARVQRADQSVETRGLRSGVNLILSRFGQGEPRAFGFTEPEDMFGFGFHL